VLKLRGQWKSFVREKLLPRT
jgi:hypothetical protein